MTIDIDKLTEAELIDLNHRIVARIRFLRQLETHVTMLEFRIGERVKFHPEGRPSVTGIVTRYNMKTVSIVTDDGQRWNVSPQLLEQADIEAHTVTPEGGNVVALPLPEGRRR